MKKMTEKLAGKITKKRVVVFIVVVAVVAAAAIIAVIRNPSEEIEESYRSIQIYQIDGTAVIEREDMDPMDAVENLYLESGDRVSVDEDSSMRLKVDDDKYILVEENSVFTIEAEGDGEDTWTWIDLEQGAMTNEIQNKLKENSSYEITTPNSVMAVRGTIFKVEVTVEEEEVYTKVSTFEGVVGITQILPDGTMEDEELLLEAGNEVVVYMDEESTGYLSDPEPIEYKSLSLPVLEVLKAAAEKGRDIAGMDIEEIENLMEERSGEVTESETEEQPALEAVEPQEEASESTESEQPKETEEAQEKSSEEAAKQKTEGSTTTKEQTKESAKEQTKTENTSSSTKTYTVTFSYQGTVFGTQTVTAGQKAAVPKLAPSSTGGWDFDFSQAITKDITINWK